MRFTVWIAVLATAIAIPTVASAQGSAHTFPRIGAYEIAGANRTVDPNYRETLAKHDIVIMGMWRGWNGVDAASGGTLSLRDVVVDIKRRAAAQGNNGLLLGKYTIYNESASSRQNMAQRDRFDKLSSEDGPGYARNNDWWVRNAAGENVSSWGGTWNTNVTEFVRRDANGDTWPEWAAKRDYENFFKPIPEFDIWFIDNLFYRPRLDADWDGDGRNDSKGLGWVQEEFRKGQMNAVRRARALAPGVIIMGNVDGDPNRDVGMLTESEYKGQVAALYEGAIGESFSQERHVGWESMMKQYQTTLANSRGGLLIMTVNGATNDYETMRYGLASCLMDDGYYYYTSPNNYYKSANWYDEYDVNLGRAIDPPQRSAWQSGVYRRRFENGMVLVNPKANGTKTVSVEPGYRRIDGRQDRATNNGQPVSSVTLRERQGLILVREGSSDDIPDLPKRPKAPVLID